MAGSHVIWKTDIRVALISIHAFQHCYCIKSFSLLLSDAGLPHVQYSLYKNIMLLQDCCVPLGLFSSCFIILVHNLGTEKACNDSSTLIVRCSILKTSFILYSHQIGINHVRYVMLGAQFDNSLYFQEFPSQTRWMGWE